MRGSSTTQDGTTVSRGFMQHHHSLSQPPATRALFNLMSVIVLVYLILVAVGAISHGFKDFSGGAEGAAQIFAFANNPFVALLLVFWPPRWCNPPAPSPR